MKLTLIMGACFFLLCLIGDVNLSIAKGKKDAQKTALLTTCVCNQVRLGPAGGDLWIWMAYRYQYETDCTTATAVSIIEFDTYDENASYPQVFCPGSTPCGNCSIRFAPGPQDQEPTISHYMHALPADKDARLDLYPPQSDLKYDIIRKRYIVFKDEKTGKERYAKVFLLCVSKNEDPTSQPDAVYFWYGFEVDGVNETTPMQLPYTYLKKRANYYLADGTKKTCKEFAYIDYNGMQFLLRLK
ncbi:MAG: hypothetical protein NXI29_27805 [bacterium]|nr:hypothetical protein [bacterium]